MIQRVSIDTGIWTGTPRETENVDVVIVGAGLAGLTAAWHLRNRRVIVLEEAQRVGGRLRSERRGRYWLNLGAHMFGGPETSLGKITSALGLMTRAIPGNRAGIAYKGAVVSGGLPETYPFRLPLNFSERIALIRMGLRLKRGVKDLMAALALREGESMPERRQRILAFENHRTFRDYVGPLSPETDLIFRTIVERTSGTPESIAAGYGLASFANVWSEYSPDRNLVGGSAQLPEGIATELGARVRTGSRVIKVNQSQENVTCSYLQDGVRRDVRAKHAVVATPAFVTREIVADLPADTAEALRQIEYGPFLTLAVLTKETAKMPFDSSYAIATPGLSFSVFFNQASVLRSGPRTSGGSLMLFRGATAAGELMDKSDVEIETAMLADLKKIFPETESIISETCVQRWPAGAPYSKVGRAALQPALSKPLGRIALAGDYLEFPNMEAAVQTGTEAANQIQSAGSISNEYRGPT